MKTAVVTGGAGGIGFAIVTELIKDGYYVFAIDVLKNEEVLDKYAKLKNAYYFVGDISVDSVRKEFADLAFAKNNGISVLVNSAGVAPKMRADILEMSEESYDRLMNINTKAMFFLTQYVSCLMLKTKEKCYIINISSLSAYTSSTSRGEYCISKAGVSMITKLFADRLASENIIVNEIRPGIIETPMTSAVKEKYDGLINNGLLPQNRWGQPSDVASVVSCLVSGKMDYTIGQSIDVDGGFHIRRL